jgi:2-aminoethylphosphonate-pyruvate transaminase
MKKLLFNPGPTNVSERVRQAIKTQDICHREKEFFEVLSAVRKKIVKAVNGQKTHSTTLFISSATGCNEAIISSIWGKILLIRNGKYSERLGEIAEKYKIPMSVLDFEEFAEIDLKKIEKALLADKKITHLLFVHHETTTGVVAPLHEIGELGRKYNKIVVADTVSSLGGYKIDLKKDKLDFFTVSANKCLESFPGVSFVIGRVYEIKKLEGKSRSFYFDLYKNWKSQEEKEQTLFTPAVQLIFALNKALDELLEEGMEARAERYKKNAQRMRVGLKKLGFSFFLPEERQSRILTSIRLPERMDYWLVHDKLKERGYTIYSGQNTLDKGVFRIATLGHIGQKDIDNFLKAFKKIIKETKVFKK